jgi:hypothetical protein
MHRVKESQKMELIVRLSLVRTYDYQIAPKLSVNEKKLVPFGVGFCCFVNQ